MGVDKVKPVRSACLGCRTPQTWSSQRRQYGRALNRGLTPEQAKASQPRCQKCMTVYLKALEGRPLAETGYEARLRTAGPELLAIARVFAAQLSDAIKLVPCVPSSSGIPCVRCLMIAEFRQVQAVLRQIEGLENP